MTTSMLSRREKKGLKVKVHELSRECRKEEADSGTWKKPSRG